MEGERRGWVEGESRKISSSSSLTPAYIAEVRWGLLCVVDLTSSKNFDKKCIDNFDKICYNVDTPFRLGVPQTNLHWRLYVDDQTFVVELFDDSYTITAPNRTKAITYAVREYRKVNPQSSIPSSVLRQMVRTRVDKVGPSEEQVERLFCGETTSFAERERGEVKT